MSFELTLKKVIRVPFIFLGFLLFCLTIEFFLILAFFLLGLIVWLIDKKVTWKEMFKVASDINFFDIPKCLWWWKL